MVAAGILFLPLSRRIKNFGGFVGTAIGVSLILLLATFAYDHYAYGETTQRWNVDNMVDTYSSSRIGTAGILLRHWAEAGPIAWIVGLGSSASYSRDILGGYPHVVMLEVLGELGVVGFAILWAIVIFAARDLYSVHRRVADDPNARGVNATIGAIFLFQVILSFKQGSLLGSEITLGLAIMVGRVGASARKGIGIPSGPGIVAAASPESAAAQGQAFAPNPSPRDDRPRRRVTPVYLPDQKPSAAGF